MLVRKFLPRDAELGDELMDMLGEGSQHTDTTVCGVPPLQHCAIGEQWWSPPLAGRLPAGRDHTVLS